jgi:serine/threonine protein kinase
MVNLVGKIIDRYKILEEIGAGGMATVYKAMDMRLEREVAVKIIRRDAFPEEQVDLMVKRFEREAKTLARLSHPHIVDIIDYGEYQGIPYLVMVYLPGGTLKQRVGHPMPWQEAAQLLIPIAHALEYAHDHNVINRDVKPSNILLTEKGEPMLTDFGLVKLLESDGVHTHLTSSGTGIGTPDYMAPEQWLGETTPQSDMYSLGVVLYELITNHKPYNADTPAGIIIKQAKDPLPPPRYYIPNLPVKVEDVILKTLEREPKNRYGNMREFANALEDLLVEQGPLHAASTLVPKALIRKQESIPEPDPIQKNSDATPLFVNTQQKVEERKSQPIPTPAPTGKPRQKWTVWLGITSAFGVLCMGALVCSQWNKITSMLNINTTTPVTSTVETSLPTEPALASTETFTPAPLASTLTPTTLPLEFTDAKGIHMRYVEAGDFIMGNENGSADVQPQSTIYLDAFYMDKYEVTNAHYRECVADGTCKRPEKGGSATRSSYFSDPAFDNYPVLFVNWQMARTYCEWRGARLPTEAEWEKSARGTDGRIYPWGDELKCSDANYFGCVGDTTPVGSYEGGKSPYGIYDLAGNVWEWVSSLDRPYPYNANDGREDTGSAGKRIARGGAWHYIGGNVNSYTRYVLDPSYYGLYVGFRCAETP